MAYMMNTREMLVDLGLLLPFDRVAADFGDMVEAGARGAARHVRCLP